MNKTQKRSETESGSGSGSEESCVKQKEAKTQNRERRKSKTHIVFWVSSSTPVWYRKLKPYHCCFSLAISNIYNFPDSIFMPAISFHFIYSVSKNALFPLEENMASLLEKIYNLWLYSGVSVVEVLYFTYWRPLVQILYSSRCVCALQTQSLCSLIFCIGIMCLVYL